MDNKIIDIYDPASSESFISGIYKRPYWIIELKVNNENSVRDQLDGNIVPYVTTRRMKNQINAETLEENERDNESKNKTESKNNKNIANADFENTVLNRKISDFSEMKLSDRKENHNNFAETQNEPSTYSKAMLWHARMGDASLNYLKVLQRKYSYIEDFKQSLTIQFLIVKYA